MNTDVGVYLKTTTGSIYNNMNYVSSLPASEFQYSWINQAVSGSDDWLDKQMLRGYAPKNGELVINNLDTGEIGKAVPAIDFPTISDVNCCFELKPTISLTWPSAVDNPGGTTFQDKTFKVKSTSPGAADEIQFGDFDEIDYSVLFDSCCNEAEDGMVIAGYTYAGGAPPPYTLKGSYDTVVWSTSKPTFVSNNGVVASIPQSNPANSEEVFITVKILGRCNGEEKSLEFKFYGVAWNTAP